MKTTYTALPEKNQLIVERSFKAEKSKVWQHYTTAELLEQWWAPAPYKAITHSFEFKEGGQWRYVMQGPEGDAHYCMNEYKDINLGNSFTAFDAFTDEQWNVKTDMPKTDWDVSFTQNGEMTDLKVILTCESAEGLETLVKMGMKEGFDQGLTQLEALLG